MGKIIETLVSIVPLRLQGLWHNVMRIEECETGNIHIHWRNTRLLLTRGQFLDFAACVQSAKENLNADKERDNWGNVVLSSCKIEEPTLDGNCICVESIERDMEPQPDWPPDHLPKFPNKIHVHYKDLRLEFEPDEFQQIKDAISSL